MENTSYAKYSLWLSDEIGRGGGARTIGKANDCKPFPLLGKGPDITSAPLDHTIWFPPDMRPWGTRHEVIGKYGEEEKYVYWSHGWHCWRERDTGEMIDPPDWWREYGDCW